MLPEDSYHTQRIQLFMIKGGVSTYQSRMVKYRRRGIRIFDNIEANPDMSKLRGPFSNNVNSIWAALQDIRADVPLCKVGGVWWCIYEP